MHSDRMLTILAEAKAPAREYRTLTGKPLGIAGEVAEYEATQLLGLTLTSARTAGYDAVRDSDGRRFQIKGRCLLPGCKPGQRLGRIDIKKDFDAVLLVLMDEKFDAQEIWEADRAPILAALSAPGSRARNVRGALGVAKFKRIGRRVWQRYRARRSNTNEAGQEDQVALRRLEGDRNEAAFSGRARVQMGKALARHAPAHCRRRTLRDGAIDVPRC